MKCTDPNDAAVYVLTAAAVPLAEMLANRIGAEICAHARLDVQNAASFVSLGEQVRKDFGKRSRMVFVCAAGIVVRLLAPLLEGKDRDPAVVVMDQSGKFAISLLSGHLGGANQLALECAAITGGQAVITTATDQAGIEAVDVLAVRHDMAIGNVEKIREVSAAMLDGHAVQFCDPHGFLNVANMEGYRPCQPEAWDASRPGIWVGWRTDAPENALRLHPRCLVAGMGCRRGTSADDLQALLFDACEEGNIAPQSIGLIASIMEKSDEEGLLLFAERLGVATKFYPREELAAVPVANPSATVLQHMGVPGVCEASALRAAGAHTLILEKRKSKNATIAVAWRK